MLSNETTSCLHAVGDFTLVNAHIQNSQEWGSRAWKFIEEFGSVNEST